MPAADTYEAIGAVTELLQQHLLRRGIADVPVGHPEQSTSTGSYVNLFLYEFSFDPSLRNVPLAEGRNPPLWLVLKYLVTAFESPGESDNIPAHRLLGRALSALQEVSILPLDATIPANIRAALDPNPEPLKVTFDEAGVDLLAKLMPGTDVSYRISAAFQVRPVMIVPAEPPSYRQLVGIDYTQAPPAEIGRRGIVSAVLPGLGPRLTSVQSVHAAWGDTVELRGEDLNVSGLEAVLGGTVVPLTRQTPERVAFRIVGPTTGATPLAAGELPLFVRQPLPGGRFRSSNLLALRVAPVVATAMPSQFIAADGVMAMRRVVITGHLLGRAADDVAVAFLREGAVVRAYDDALTFAPDQTSLTLEFPRTAPPGIPPAPTPGDYLVIVRVNGQQARLSPPITLAP